MTEVVKNRRILEEEARKNHILVASERLFAEKGLQSTSMADIARAAEFGVGTIYKYFQDKKTLIRSLVSSRLGDHLDELERAIRGPGSPLDRINATINAYFDSVAKRRVFFRLYYTNFHPGLPDDGCSGPVERESLFCSRKTHLLDKLATVFAEAVASRQVSDLDPDCLAAALFGTVMAFVFNAERHGDTAWDLDWMKSSVRTIFFEQIRLAEFSAVEPVANDDRAALPVPAEPLSSGENR